MLNPEQSIRATFDVFHPDVDDVIEVRAMESYTFSGYFKDRENLIEHLKVHGDKTWYFVMNKITDACYSREQHERILSAKKMKTTGDGEIERLQWILVDADPNRPAGVSSTNDEKAKAYQTIQKVYRYLRDEGFSAPVVCDSGNGYHLLYKISMRTESADSIKRFLQALDMLFSDEYVSIDTAVFNPSRITKVYGTTARKGANTTDRPHRSSGIMHIPENVEITSKTLIDKIAGQIPQPEQPTYRTGYEAFDLDKFISETGIGISSDTRTSGKRKIVLEQCPFDSSHKAPDSAIFVLDNGAIAFKCFHNSCQDKRWQDVRTLFDPAAYERKAEENRDYELPPRPDKQKQDEPEEPHEQHFLRLCDIQVIDRSKIICVKTGIAALDKQLIGMNKGELSIWSGGNGSGKSTMLSQIALETIERGFKVAMFSGELTDNRMKSWLQLQAAGRQHTILSSNNVSYYVPTRKAECIDAWAADKLWIYNNRCGAKARDVLNSFEQHMEEHETDVIIIDNLMAIDLTSFYGEKYDRQTEFVLTLSALAKRYNVHIHFVCHPRKGFGFLRKADISGTADLTNAADNVFMMHRVNEDFKKQGGEYLGKERIVELSEYTNVIEIMKNRDLGVSDEFVGLFFEPESKRMLNERHENRVYSWEQLFFGEDGDIPF